MDSVSARFLGREKDKRRWYWTQRFCISSDLRYIEILRRRALGTPAAESEEKVCEMAFAAIHIADVIRHGIKPFLSASLVFGRQKMPQTRAAN